MRADGPAVFKELVRLAIKSKSEQTRVAAIKEILDRAYGRPTQPIDGDGQGGAVIVNVANPAKVLPVRGETMRSLGPEHPDTKGACSVVSQPYDRDIAAAGRVTNGLVCMAETPEQRVVGHFE